MADLPFLLFPRPVRAPRGVPPGGGHGYTKPTAAQQQARLQNTFNQIVQSFQNLQATVAGVDPEQVIVLETLTASVENVAKAVIQITGLEWLAERDLEEVPPGLGFGDPATDATIPKRLYALMSNQNGMTQLLALWNDWAANPGKIARRNFGPFKQLFTLLRDIRRWSAQDRIENTGILQRWQEDVAVGHQSHLKLSSGPAVSKRSNKGPIRRLRISFKAWADSVSIRPPYPKSSIMPRSLNCQRP
jgi:hypothetical protein